MRYEILDAQGDVVNTILADSAFVEKAYPGRFREVAESVAPLPKPTLTKLAFRSRFTDAEKAAIYTAAVNNVQIRIWLDDLASASEVDLTFPATVAGVRALEAAGLIGAGRAAIILGG